MLDALLLVVTVGVEKFVLILGPLLICFASVIIGGLAHTFFTILLPMIQLKHSGEIYLHGLIPGNMIVAAHIFWVFFLLLQITFNYYQCVRTSNHHDPKKNPLYQKVVRELAEATNVIYPENPQALEIFRRDYEDKLIIRMRRRQARDQRDEEKSAEGLLEAAPESEASMKQRKQQSKAKKPLPNPKPAQIRNWMLMAPDEWGYCGRSNQAKPPRAHYDHVSKALVLNLDHYCPWMFNAGEKQMKR